MRRLAVLLVALFVLPVTVADAAHRTDGSTPASARIARPVMHVSAGTLDQVGAGSIDDQASVPAFKLAGGPRATAAPPPRTALTHAGRSLHALAGQASSSSVRSLAAHAVRELAQAVVPSLWIDARQAVAPSYGASVFADSVAALTDLQRLERLSVPGLSAAITLIVGADRDLAEAAITQARGGNHGLLVSTKRLVGAGDRGAAAGHLASAARSYAKAWESAFEALAQLVAGQATTMPPAALAAAAGEALGSKSIALAGPAVVQGQPLLTLAGKPELFFAGSDPCPFCAVQRWGAIVALSQFGTFSNLHLMQSTPVEPPVIRTFTFFGSRYQSPYISFLPVELLSNVPEKFGFAPLQRLTPSEHALFDSLDPPERVPFIDVANRFVRVNSTVQPDLLGGMSWTQIAGSLKHPTSISAQAIGGEAEVLTAELCTATNGNPASVCSSAIVHRYQAALPLLDGKGGGCPTKAMTSADRRSQLARPPRARLARCHT